MTTGDCLERSIERSSASPRPAWHTIPANTCTRSQVSLSDAWTSTGRTAWPNETSSSLAPWSSSGAREQTASIISGAAAIPRLSHACRVAFACFSSAVGLGCIHSGPPAQAIALVHARIRTANRVRRSIPRSFTLGGSLVNRRGEDNM